MWLDDSRTSDISLVSSRTEQDIADASCCESELEKAKTFVELLVHLLHSCLQAAIHLAMEGTVDDQKASFYARNITRKLF
ncbi:unnamed protein product [Onchocerca ochengi]|uniref:Uncharacterized protein n=1 Tax=Onchocerca ochengi TaxID=42157 RepID=A0A182E4H5_ONCOC|nr:unnamed protein product [Onchocerca ochengi]